MSGLLVEIAPSSAKGWEIHMEQPMQAKESNCSERREDGLVPPSSSPALLDVKALKYQDHLEKMTEIAQSNSLVHEIVIGQSSGQILEPTRRSPYKFRSTTPQPIVGLERNPDLELRGQILIVGGHHATEPAGPVAALEGFQQTLASGGELGQSLRDHFRVTVVPVVDVDNYSIPFDLRQYSPRSNNFYHELSSDGPEWVPTRGGFIPAKAGAESVALARALRNRIVSGGVNIVFDCHEGSVEDKPWILDYEVLEGFWMRFPSAPKPGGLSESIFNRLEKLGLHCEDPSNWKWPGNESKSWPHTDGPATFVEYAESLGAVGYLQESPLNLLDTGAEVDPGVRVKMHLACMDEVLRWVVSRSMK